MGSKKGMNQVVVVGNLGKDADMKYTGTGKPVVNFSLAATTGYGDYEHTEWFNCVAWGDRFTNVVQYLKKGRTVGVTGSLKTRSWEDNDGKKHFKTELVVNDITLLSNGDAESNGAGAPDAQPESEEEIPF